METAVRGFTREQCSWLVRWGNGVWEIVTSVSLILGADSLRSQWNLLLIFYYYIMWLYCCVAACLLETTLICEFFSRSFLILSNGEVSTPAEYIRFPNVFFLRLCIPHLYLCRPIITLLFYITTIKLKSMRLARHIARKYEMIFFFYIIFDRKWREYTIWETVPSAHWKIIS